MKVQLSTKAANCRAYGLEFDCDGVAVCDAKVAQSLLDTGALTELKPTEKPKS